MTQSNYHLKLRYEFKIPKISRKAHICNRLPEKVKCVSCS